MANVIILSFDNEWFERAELAKMNDQELYDLYQNDENDRIKRYELDEFTCAINDEMVNDQGNWFFTCDLNKVSVAGSVKKISVEILCDEFYVADSLHELAGNIECGDLLDDMENDGIEVSGDHYTAGIKIIKC